MRKGLRRIDNSVVNFQNKLIKTSREGGRAEERRGQRLSHNNSRSVSEPREQRIVNNFTC